ncbi:MAG: DNA-3-methyladenine glycosylase I, partial [Candidatus Marinimicrobia bacterium]|nr:DNA-3-methyladenine glycosylase I [Candidatus Neomarinimicrobiota bacterium]
MTEPDRCWGEGDPLMQTYHDDEWGVPLHDDRGLFEFLLLDNFQAGLSWRTILHKRENFRAAFDNFDAKKIAAYGEEKILALLQDAGIIRNRSKVRSAVTNAQAFLKIQQEFGSFDNYLWRFTGGKTLFHPPVEKWDETHVTTPQSDA